MRTSGRYLTPKKPCRFTANFTTLGRVGIAIRSQSGGHDVGLSRQPPLLEDRRVGKVLEQPPGQAPVDEPRGDLRWQDEELSRASSA